MQILRPARRAILFGAAAAGLAGASSLALAGGADAAFVNSPFRRLSPEEWRKRLSPASFGVLREEDTEVPYSSPLNNEHRRGTFICMGCDLPLFKSDWKFDSGTGWPSFYAPIVAKAVEQVTDTSDDMVRTEVKCSKCGGHLGHVFDDGPKPTGLRYCMNSVAMKFIPDAPAKK